VASGWPRSSWQTQAGATVISTASSDQELERLKPFRLDHGINYASESFVDRTRELTDGRGADVILDSVGGQNLVDSIGALAYRGMLVSVGVAGRAGSNIEARDLWAQNNALRGVFLGGALMSEYPPRPRDDRGPVRAGRGRRGCASRSTEPSRSPRPPPHTRTSRAASPSVAS
jgi:NADPH:quinone reductase-like Zn-dependent oxidoreductase